MKTISRKKAAAGSVVAVMLTCVSTQATPQQAAPVSQGKAARGGFRPNSSVRTVRPTFVMVTSGSGRKTRVALHKGQRLMFYSPQMTRDSIVRLPDSRLGFIHTRDIQPVRP